MFVACFYWFSVVFPYEFLDIPPRFDHQNPRLTKPYASTPCVGSAGTFGGLDTFSDDRCDRELSSDVLYVTRASIYAELQRFLVPRLQMFHKLRIQGRMQFFETNTR